MPTNITKRKIRFAIAGCGRISQNHIQAIQAYPKDAELIAICDPNQKQREQTAKSTKAKAYEDLTELLNKEDIDIVSVCTPSGMHANQTQQIAQAQSHVLCEKPMATTLADGKKMVQTCEKLDKHLFIVKQNRLNPTCQQLKKAIDTNRFGQIYQIVVNVFWSRGQDYYNLADWRGTLSMDGGAFMNQASHFVDIALWLIGKPLTSVFAQTATLARNIEAEDTGIAILNWQNKTLGSINVTMLTYPENLEGSIIILGEKGTAKIDGIALNNITHWQFADQQPQDKTIQTTNYQTESVYGKSHTEYYKNVINVLRGKEKPLVDGREGLKTLEALRAIHESSQQQKIINLPLK